MEQVVSYVLLDNDMKESKYGKRYKKTELGESISYEYVGEYMVNIEQGFISIPIGQVVDIVVEVFKYDGSHTTDEIDITFIFKNEIQVVTTVAQKAIIPFSSDIVGRYFISISTKEGNGNHIEIGVI